MIAIIAGTGTLPLEACKSLLASQKPFFVISLFPENNLKELQQITGSNAQVFAQPFYKVGTVLDLLKNNHARQALLIGKVDKNNLLKKIKLDWVGIKFLASLISKSDATIMEKVVFELAQRNIEVINQDAVLTNLFIKPGVVVCTLTPDLEANIKLGMQTALTLSQCDIGQTVIVKDKMVLAVEAIEGTDLCIKRGIELGKTNVIICKAAHHNQNKKFDLPTLGPHSLKTIKPGDVLCIAWLSSHTFIA